MTELTEQPIDVRAVEAAVAGPADGAVCTFQGIVRDNNLGRSVDHLVYEAYPTMAVPAMQRIVDDVAARWPGARAAIVHRTGRLEIGEPSVVIAVSSPHRAAAFEACRYAIDTLKTTVPVWKKEVWVGGEAWIEGVAPAPLDSNPFAGPG
jgi:molybdopterin synthase catalytic subunit